MAAMLRRGSVTWADLTDRHTGQPARRPVVVVSPTRDLLPGGTALVVVVSTDVVGTPAENAVALPAAADGSAPTGLRQPCVAVCDWLEVLPVAALDAPRGAVPAGVLAVILSKVAPSA